MPSNESSKILIVAAEASSCLYARRLLELWRAQGLNVEAFGVGDEAMAKIGFENLAKAEDLAVVGLQEVFAHWSVIKTAFHKLVAAAQLRKPQVVLLLDYPGFNLRLAKRLKKMGLPIVYYISPQVWAWKTGRVKLIRETIDRMLVVLPFEKEFYAKHDMQVDFVGHPLLDEMSEELLSKEFQAERRARYGIRDFDLVLALMPGSRRSELRHHLETQLRVAERLQKRLKNLKVMLFVAPGFDKDELLKGAGELSSSIILVKDEPFKMISLADVILCASGTATLMVGLMLKPMVVMYKMNGLTAWLAKRIVKSTRFFALINLVLDKKVVEELFQGDASVERLEQELFDLLSDPNRRSNLAVELSQARHRLGTTGATERVSEIVSGYWGKVK